MIGEKAQWGRESGRGKKSEGKYNMKGGGKERKKIQRHKGRNRGKEEQRQVQRKTGEGGTLSTNN